MALKQSILNETYTTIDHCLHFINHDNIEFGVYKGHTMKHVYDNLINYPKLKMRLIGFDIGDILFIKYEDVLYKQKDVIDNVAEFLDLKPLYINDMHKYRDKTIKYTGIFKYLIDEVNLSRIYEKYKTYTDIMKTHLNIMICDLRTMYHF